MFKSKTIPSIHRTYKIQFVSIISEKKNFSLYNSSPYTDQISYYSYSKFLPSAIHFKKFDLQVSPHYFMKYILV